MSWPPSTTYTFRARILGPILQIDRSPKKKANGSIPQLYQPRKHNILFGKWSHALSGRHDEVCCAWSESNQYFATCSGAGGWHRRRDRVEASPYAHYHTESPLKRCWTVYWNHRDWNQGASLPVQTPQIQSVCDVLHWLWKNCVECKELTAHHSMRYFVGDDALEYRWKIMKGIGCKLIRCDTHTEIASSSSSIVNEGVFAGETKQMLRIQPCSIDIDLVVLTFIIMEKKRRERDGYADAQYVPYEEVQGDGGGSGEGEADAEAGVIGEL